MTTPISSFKKIKKIIANIKKEIDNFQKRINNISQKTSQSYQNTNSFNSSLLLDKSNSSGLSRKEKIDFFNKTRKERLQEVKRQLKFLDYLFLSETKDNQNQKNYDYSKLSSIKEVLDLDKDYLETKNDDSFLSIISSTGSLDKETDLLNSIVQEAKKIDLEEEKNNSINKEKDLVLTQDFLLNLKKQGKEITENFQIIDKETKQNNIDEDQLLFSVDIVPNKTDSSKKGKISENEFIDLINKK